MAIWDGIKNVFGEALTFLHGILEPLFGIHSWGWSIIALTIIVRVLLLPLAVKQTRSMRAMQALQPKTKALQKKYKVDRDLMRKDPETYKARKQKLNEEMMALYKEEGVNPASGCLPLVLQAPIFLALFQVLRDFDEIRDAPFYFFTDHVAAGNTNGQGLGAFVNEVGWPGWLLIVLMSATMFWSQRQMMARNASGKGEDNPQAQQQKIIMYVMPVFLAFISQRFPLGVLLYWVTTNIWQMGQQAVILREVKQDDPSGGASPAKPTKTPAPKGGDNGKASPKKDAKAENKTPDSSNGGKRKRDHLPSRGDATNR
jgi:YidC/Oxa1 family membrane protein insertase